MNRTRETTKTLADTYCMLLSLPKTLIADAWYLEAREKEKAVSFIRSKGLYTKYKAWKIK